MRKKSQGLSITTIIVAAIALIVLVVLVAIFTGRIGGFSKGISSVSTCESLGGKCQSNDCSSSQQKVFGALDCDRDIDRDGTKENTNKPYCCKHNKIQNSPSTTTKSA